MSLSLKERREMIRRRHRAIAGSLAYVPSGLPLKRKDREAKRGEYPIYAATALYAWHVSDWVKKPDANPERAIGERNRAGVSPLIRFAEQLPAKLPVVPLWP
jgi:hypothetical protein